MAKARLCVTPPLPCALALTFLAVLPFVACRTHAVALNAGAVAPTGGVNALVHGHVTLCAFPAAVALARSFRILSVPTAQDGAGGCGNQRQNTRSPGAAVCRAVSV